MLTITFICKGLKKRTCPCCEGSNVAEKLGVPKDQQKCYCGRFVEELPRAKGVPKYHTCIRELGGMGTMFVTQGEKDILRIEIRLKEHPDPDNLYRTIRYLEERHPGTTWRTEEDDPSKPFEPRFESTKPPVDGPPPENVEEHTPPDSGEPRPRNISPEEIAKRGYRGPVAGPPPPPKED